MLAYPLSRKDMPLSGPLAFLVFFTILFSGGLVPTYMVYTRIFHIKNTIFGLLVPSLLLSPIHILIARSYFKLSIPPNIIESAKIDGAGEGIIFFRFILPLSLPILATIGLLSGIHYWNDWNNGLIYILKPELYNMQNLLYRMMQNIMFLTTQQEDTGIDTSAMPIPSSAVRMAIAVVGALPMLFLFPLFQQYFVKGIVLGAVKE
ncbi:L-arabinose transport system permease protein AraQ [compost metagenome]